MPITYNQQPNSIISSNSTPTLTSTPTIQDADSSIVLSDLLRSGETSRLRRRGAVRLDTLHRHEDTRTATSTLDEEEECFQLYCKECDTPGHQPVIVSSPQTPFRPSLFPLRSSQLLSPQPTDSKGKGRYFEPHTRGRTLVHNRVMAQRLPHIDASLHVHPPSSSTYPPTSAQVIAFLIRAQHNNSAIDPGSAADFNDSDTENGVLVWTSVSEPVEGVVVPMHYEDDSNQPTEPTDDNASRFMSIDELARRRPGPISTACMCKREVVGCAVCGSPLGMRYTPCSSALKKIFPLPANIPPSPIPPQTFIRPNSTYLPASHARTPSIDPDSISYRSRVADYLLSMTTPRTTRTTSAAPSTPDFIRVTPELHNGTEHARRSEVSILPRIVPSRDHRSSPAMPRDRQGSSSSRIQENSHNDENMPDLLNVSADSETDTDDDTDDSQNDDHYRLPMITQIGHDSTSSNHWAYETPTKHVYRFFAEAVIPGRHSKGATLTDARGHSSLTDWRQFYANLYGLGLQNYHSARTGNGDAGNRLSCG